MDQERDKPMAEAEAQGDNIHPPCGVTVGAESPTVQPLNGSSRTTVTCVPEWKMRIFSLIFYF
jgi:hypothetical protein